MRGTLTVARWELRTLRALWRTRLALLLCAVGPFVFMGLLHSQSQLPVDTLYGRWVKESGFALPLLVLGFVAQWAFPALTALVAGDLFSSEDAHGTWKTILTRSRSKGEVFAGKVLAATAWTLLLLMVLAVASTLAGLLITGDQPLVGLSGQLVPAGHAMVDVLAAWASTVPAVLGFTAFALLLSLVSRSSVVGVVGPVVVGLLMQLYAFLGRSDLVGHLLLTLHFYPWHGFLLDRPSLRPLGEAVAVSAAYVIGCLWIAWSRFRDRDEVG